MKSVKFLALLALAACIFLLPACTQSNAQTPDRLASIKARGYLEVVMEPYFAPNQFIDPTKPKDQQVVGADVELSQYIAQKLGVACRIIPLEFSAVLAGVTEGKYDMAISSLAYTPARAQAMSLSQGYYFSQNNRGHGLIIREELKDAVTGPSDVAGRTVVAQSGSLQELFVTEQLEGYSAFKRVSSTSDMFLSVQEGKAEVGVTSIPTAELFINANPGCGLYIVEGFTFFQDENTLGTRIGMPPEEEALLAEVNAIIDEVLKSGIYEQWYAQYTEYAKTLGVD